MQLDTRLANLAPFFWLAFIIAMSIFYRRYAGKPIFPRAPVNAVFIEKRCSGHSRSNILTTLGGASNCLLVYVADRSVHIVPQFPFNLMLLPEVWRLEVSAAASTIKIISGGEIFGRTSIILTIGRPDDGRSFRLWLRRPSEFRAALTQCQLIRADVEVSQVDKGHEIDKEHER